MKFCILFSLLLISTHQAVSTPPPGVIPRLQGTYAAENFNFTFEVKNWIVKTHFGLPIRKDRFLNHAPAVLPNPKLTWNWDKTNLFPEGPGYYTVKGYYNAKYQKTTLRWQECHIPLTMYIVPSNPGLFLYLKVPQRWGLDHLEDCFFHGTHYVRYKLRQVVNPPKKVPWVF